MSTLHDVARLAGVAPITVSRVVNNNGYVSDEKRERIEAAIRELNYVPNALGPSLRLKRTQTLALLLSDITNPFWTTVARGVEDTANQQGYHVIIANTDESIEKQEEYLTFLQKKQVDGFLVVPVAASPALHMLQKRKIPYVIVDRHLPGKPVDTVRSDSFEGAYLLTKHLLELGHRRIALITGPQYISTASDRVAGFQRALAEAGLNVISQMYHGKFNQQTGYDCTREALQTVPRPTAIVATNNFIAIGTMRALREAGLRVPEDLSVVAFDDLPEAITIDPFFTVAAQPAYEMGQQATSLLLARLNGEAAQPYQEIVLPVEIIIRKSSARPPDKL
jgi:LacI family transcriptional regulator